MAFYHFVKQYCVPSAPNRIGTKLEQHLEQHSKLSQLVESVLLYQATTAMLLPDTLQCHPNNSTIKSADSLLCQYKHGTVKCKVILMDSRYCKTTNHKMPELASFYDEFL